MQERTSSPETRNKGDARSYVCNYTPAKPKLGWLLIFAQKITRVLQLLLPMAQGVTPGSEPGQPDRPFRLAFGALC